MAGSILNHFFSFYPHLKDKPFFADYRRRSLVLGQEITVLEGGQTRTAFALDLERDFSLRVRETDGHQSIPYPPGRFGSGGSWLSSHIFYDSSLDCPSPWGIIFFTIWQRG